jgi:hypothetical protein
LEQWNIKNPLNAYKQLSDLVWWWIILFFHIQTETRFFTK